MMIKVCKTLHAHTDYCVRILGGVSSTWKPDRGLREGCPSSPVLFNIFHDGVMQDFRARRAEAAERDGRKPGIVWHYKVDGRIKRTNRVRKTKWGDKGFKGELRVRG